MVYSSKHSKAILVNIVICRYLLIIISLSIAAAFVIHTSTSNLTRNQKIIMSTRISNKRISPYSKSNNFSNNIRMNTIQKYNEYNRKLNLRISTRYYPSSSSAAAASLLVLHQILNNNNDSDDDCKYQNDNSTESINKTYKTYKDQIDRRKRRRQSSQQPNRSSTNKMPNNRKQKNHDSSDVHNKYECKVYNNNVTSRNQSSSSSPSVDTSSNLYSKTIRKRRRRQLKNNRTKRPLSSSPSSYIDEVLIPNSLDISTQAIHRIGKIATQTAKKSKRIIDDLGNEINNFIDDDDDYDNDEKIDENGIQEVDWYYVSKDDVNDSVGGWVKTKRRKRNKTQSKNNNKRTSKSHYDVQHYEFRNEKTDPQRRRRQVKKQRYDKDNIRTRRVYYNDVNIENNNHDLSKKDIASTMVNVEETSLLLPPSSLQSVTFPPITDTNSTSTSLYNETGVESQPQDENSNNSNNVTSPQCRTRIPNDKTKTIYSVYPNQDEDTVMKEKLEEFYGKAAAEAIDSVGNIVADVMEGKYSWNSNNAPNVSGEESHRRHSKNINNSKQGDFQQHPKKKHSSRRNWRDRLNERFDYALGIHEDNKYYKRWEEKLNQEKMSKTGNDPVSIFYGRQKRHHEPKRKIRFWEEDGSLMSLFFGRTPNGEKLSFNRASSVNICTTAFKMSFKYTIAVLSQICRWASCRGSLPQPIVVFFLAASALSAPRKQKLFTVGVTLIGLRTLAEALHGYIHDDWDDNQEQDNSPTSLDKDSV